MDNSFTQRAEAVALGLLGCFCVVICLVCLYFMADLMGLFGRDYPSSLWGFVVVCWIGSILSFYTANACAKAARLCWAEST